MTEIAKYPRLREIMAGRGLDALLLWPSKNWVYLLGHAPVALERPTFLMISPSGVAAVVPEMDREEVLASGLEAVFGWRDQDGPARAIAAGCEAVGLGAAVSIGIDDTMPFSYLKAMEGFLAGKALSPASEAMMEMRLIKDGREVEGIRRTSQLLERALARCGEVFRPGITEKQAELRFKGIMLEEGADTLDFIMVQAAPNSASGHHLPDGTVVEKGLPVLMDLALSYAGFYSDITRNACLGEPGAKYRKIYDIVRRAQAAGVRAVKPGRPLSEVDDAARSIIAEAGYGHTFTTRTGHGLGLEVHEPPSVRAGNAEIMQPGMVFTIEPGIYLPDEFGIRIEDTVLVTEDGVESLTSFDRELLVL